MQPTTTIASDRLQEAPRITALRMVTVARTPRFIGKCCFGYLLPCHRRYCLFLGNKA